MYQHLEQIPVEQQEKLGNVCMSIHGGVAVSFRIVPSLMNPLNPLVLSNQLQAALLPLSVRGWDVTVWTGPVEEE
jgi:hypothetical protein